MTCSRSAVLAATVCLAVFASAQGVTDGDVTIKAAPTVTPGPNRTFQLYWPLSYVRRAALDTSVLTPPAQAGTPAPPTPPSDPLLAPADFPLGIMLERLYEGVHVTKAPKGIILHSASERQLKSAVTLIATGIDIPQPQVRTEVWALSVSKPLEHRRGALIEGRLDRIRRATNSVRSLVRVYQAEVSTAVASAQLSPKADRAIGHLLGDLGLVDQKLSLASATQLPKPFAHTLLLMRALDRADLGRRLEQVGAERSALARAVAKLKEPGDSPEATRWNALLACMASRAGTANALRTLLSEGQEGDLELLRQFLSSLVDPDNSALKGSNVRHEPVGEFVKRIQTQIRTSQVVDRMLRDQVDAIQADLEDVFYGPLRDYVRDQVDQVGGVNDGLSTLGSTTLVSSDAEQGSIQAELSVYTPSTKVPSIADVVGGQGGQGGQGERHGEGGEGGASGPGAGFLNPLFGSANVSPQASFILGTLFRRDTTEYHEVAPGLTLFLRPSISADAGSASLDLSLTYGLGEDDLKNRTDKVDRVKTLKARTQMEVAANDLFEFASMSTTVSVPGDRERILFIPGRRKTKQVQQGVLLIANLTIVPRSLDFFSRQLTSN